MKAYELFESYQWNQGEYALGENGNSVSPDNERAVSFCVIGALTRCYRKLSERFEAYERLASHIPDECRKYVTSGSAIVKWNDRQSRTKEEVVEMLRKADV